MRIKIFIISVIVILFSSFAVYAENNAYIVRFKPDVPVDFECFNAVSPRHGIYSFDNMELINGLEEYIEYVEENKRVFLIEGEPSASVFSLPSDELYAEQWQLQMINADAFWKLETYGNDIKVAVIDSGCYPHEDLSGNILEGKNYVNGTTDVTDTYGHGTHVTGIIAANGNDTGIIGIAPKVKIVPLKCFNSVDGYIEDIVAAIYDAVDIYGCRIINMSWGIEFDDKSLKEAIDYADEHGVIMVAAVGNWKPYILCYPAAYDNVIGVGSIGMTKEASVFTKNNKSVMAVAPGEKVKSTYLDGAYHELGGTSQAAPMVTGLAAVALSADNSITSDEFIQLIADTAEDIGDMGYDTQFGWGLVDGAALMNEIMTRMDYYVSPINDSGDESYVLIRNNSQNVLSGTSIFSEYTDGRFVGNSSVQMTLMAGKELIIKTDKRGDDMSHFLWNGMTDQKPLRQARK